MIRDDQNPSIAMRFGWQLRLAGFVAIALLVVAMVGVQDPGRTGLTLSSAPPEGGSPHTTAAVPDESKLFRDWPNKPPDVALVLSGQMHGYYHPCGCSRPQFGGLERRWNFVKALELKGWPVVAVDLGDVFDEPKKRSPQYMVKYRTSMEAMKLIGYSGVGIGEYEMNVPLINALAEYALNNKKPPVIATNLVDPQKIYADMVFPSTLASKDGMPKVGVAHIVGPSVKEKVKPTVAFGDTQEKLPKAYKELQGQGAEIFVLLYQGTTTEAEACARWAADENEAKKANRSTIPFHVVLCLSEEEEPSNKPKKVGDTLVIHVGHKGRYVGVVAVYRTGAPLKPLELRYELVAMTETYETPKGQDKANPILGLFEEYAKEVKRDDYLIRFPKNKHPVQLLVPQAEYVGSDRCQKCHPDAFQVWKNHPHAHAYKTLVEATRPSLRQFDGECIVCHTVGFQHEKGFQNEKATPLLIDVGCESCHGPGSHHIKNPNDMKIRDLMNPFRHDDNESAAVRKKRLDRIDQSCQQCHDADNDVHWDFKKKWPKVVHEDLFNKPGPRKNP